jgi:queuine/archaeosine tRNA-ribosyltransferase
MAKQISQMFMCESYLLGIKTSAGGFRVGLLLFICKASQSNKCFENVVKFKHLDMTFTNKHHMYEGIKGRSYKGHPLSSEYFIFPSGI